MGLARRVGGGGGALRTLRGALSILTGVDLPAPRSRAPPSFGAPAMTETSCKGDHGHEYDVVVIGGGSGGLAAAKEAAKHGAKTMCLDFVKPSPAGTTWGLGGTCVNVGCIPKKLMHQAGILGESFSDAREYGWKLASEGHDWGKMVEQIQNHIGSLNFGYRTTLREKNVTYVNAYGRLKEKSPRTTRKKRGRERGCTRERVVMAWGGRPA